MVSYDYITQTTPYACSHLSRKDVVISRKLSLAWPILMVKNENHENRRFIANRETFRHFSHYFAIISDHSELNAILLHSLSFSFNQVFNVKESQFLKNFYTQIRFDFQYLVFSFIFQFVCLTLLFFNDIIFVPTLNYITLT